MADEVRPNSQNDPVVTPYLTVKGADRAIAFYREAFGAEETCRMAGPSGESIMHAEVRIGGSPFYLSDECHEMGAFGPSGATPSPVTLFVRVEDVDATFAKAVEAGATPVMPPADMFWGDRFAALTDPFGHSWSLVCQIEALSPEEIKARAEASFAGAQAEA